MRIRINRTDFIALALALVTLLALSFAPDTAFGQDGNTSAQQQNGPSATEGIVTKRTADTFTVRNAEGTETVVVLTDTTTVRWFAKGYSNETRFPARVTSCADSDKKPQAEVMQTDNS